MPASINGDKRAAWVALWGKNLGRMKRKSKKRKEKNPKEKIDDHDRYGGGCF